MAYDVAVRTLNGGPVRFALPPGMTVWEIVEQTTLPAENLMVLNHGAQIKDWQYITKEGDSIAILLVPSGGGGGGKAILSSIALIAITMVAPFMGAVTSTALGFTSVGAAGHFASAFKLIAALALVALIPPPSAKAEEKQSQFFSGQSNQVNLYGIVPRVYGRVKFAPYLAANTIIENVGTTSRIANLYDFGIGDLEITDILVGDTALSTYTSEYRVVKGQAPHTFQYMTAAVGYQQFANEMKDQTPVYLTSRDDAMAVSIDILFPAGLAKISDRGNTLAYAVGFKTEYKAATSTTWLPVNGTWTGSTLGGSAGTGLMDVTGGTRQSFVMNVFFNLPSPGKYDFRVTRMSAYDPSDKVLNTTTLTLIKSWRASGDLVKSGASHTLLEMRMVASEKISGNVTNLTAIAQSKLRWFDANLNEQAAALTRNPAWIVLDILTGEANPRPLTIDQIDLASFRRLADFCDETVTTNVGGTITTGPRHLCDMVVDFETTVAQLCSSILSSCRAQLLITQSGKYGVFIDKEQSVSRQLFTPDNSWNFTGNRTFIDIPHAMRVSFVDPDTNWAKSEVMVYNDGYNASNATIFEELDTVGITRGASAWRYGRYMLAQGIHRSEVLELTVDAENIVVQRGERVSVAHDVPKIGGMAARIIAMNNTVVKVDQPTDTLFTHFTVRRSDGTLMSGTVGKPSDAIASAFAVSNAITLPGSQPSYDGSNTAYKIVPDTANSVKQSVVTPTGNLSAGTTYVVTFYGKLDPAATSPEIVGFRNGASSTFNIGIADGGGFRANLKTGETAGNTSMTSVGGGWFKIQHRFKPQTTARAGFFIRPMLANGTFTFAGNGSAGIFVSPPIISIDETDYASEWVLSNVTGVQADDLIVLGFADRVVKDYLITEIQPGDDMSATLRMVAYEPAVYTADEGLIPPWNPGFGDDGVAGGFGVRVTHAEATQSLSYPNREPMVAVALRWTVSGPVGAVAEYQIAASRDGGPFEQVGSSTGQTFTHTINPRTDGQWLGGVVTYRITPISKLGAAGGSGDVSITPVGDTVPPSPPTYFAVNVVSNNLIEMFWGPSPDADIAVYELRYSPHTNATDWNSSQPLSEVSWQTTHSSVGARTGTYMIRAVDTSGNVSTPLMRRTTVETLPDVNEIKVLDDTTPGYPGTRSGLTIDGSTLVTAAGTEGTYTFHETVDLGDVFEVRISSKILAKAISPITRATMDAAVSDWDVWLELRAVTSANMMSSWVRLSDINPIGQGSAAWGDWRQVQVGDFTGRMFQFRIQCRPKAPNVIVVIQEAKVVIDVPDRVWGVQDVTISSNGTRISFDPSFMEPPAIAVTIDGNSDDVFTRLSSRDRSGVTVALISTATNAQVAGKVDIMAKGYGRKGSAAI